MVETEARMKQCRKIRDFKGRELASPSRHSLHRIFQGYDFAGRRMLALFLITALFVLSCSNFIPPKTSRVIASSGNPAIEQQIDIQTTNMTTTSATYTDANGSGFFYWNSQRYASLQHVYFEAGIAKAGAPNTTKRIRSGDILANLVDNTIYKVRIEYGCSYSSTTNTFTESGYAELWTSDNTTEVTASAVNNIINSGSGTCPTTPTLAAVRFSRLIILQANPNTITDTNTSINIGHTETRFFQDTNDYPLNYPKIWLYTAHSTHTTAGWDSIQDILFSATLASPNGLPVYACLYDITSSAEIACVSTTNITATYVTTSSDIQGLLQDGHQYETYLKVSTAMTKVSLYNSYITIEQSATGGLTSIELYYDFNPYNAAASSTNYGRGFFMNYWEPANFSGGPATILAFHVEVTEQTSNTSATASAILYTTCSPDGGCHTGTVPGANMDTSTTGFTRVRTADNAFAMPTGNELDEGGAVKGGSGTITGNVTWLIINVNFIPTYPVQITKGIAYGPEPNEVMDQCIPVGAPPGRPGIIFVHGGGWGYEPETRAHFSALCQTYAAEGYIVDNIDYRLAPQYQWTDQGGDVQLAVRFMRSTASLTGLDPTRICAYGDSAGAHLALLLDELQSIHSADVSSILANFSPTVECVVDQFGPADLARLYNENPNTNPNVRQTLYNFLDYQTPQSDPAIYSDASPATYVTAQAGQALIIQGTKDAVVLPDQSQELQQDLQLAGVSNQYMSYIGGHEYYSLTQQQTNLIVDQINSFLLSVEHP